MNIGIATPLHWKDIMYVAYNKRAVFNLEPESHVQMYYLNNGEKGLKYYRTSLFNSLFHIGCDIVLQCSIDFYLLKDILSYVNEKRITTFAYLKYKPSYVIDFIRFKVSPSMWTGCYTITRDFWELLKKDGSFDGNDYSVMKFAKKINYPIKRVRTPSYILLNPSKADPFKDIEDYPLWKKIIRKISWAGH